MKRYENDAVNQRDYEKGTDVSETGAYLGTAIGRPTLNVSPEEKEKLTMLARRLKTGQALAMRARIVLGCSDGLSNGEVARRLRITGATVCKWRGRFRGCRQFRASARALRRLDHCRIRSVVKWKLLVTRAYGFQWEPEGPFVE
jgi:hypothetical protein